MSSEHARWLREYARGARRAARAQSGAQRARSEEMAERLLAAAAELEARGGGRLAGYARVDEVAGRLGIHVEYARKLMRQGRLRGVRVGRVWLMERGELESVAAGYEPHQKWGDG